MNTFDLVFNLIILIISCGALGYVGDFLHKHHKANRVANGLELAQKIANWSVARVANDSNLAMGQRRTAVVRELQTVLTNHGYKFDIKRLAGLAEMTYQVYKANGHNIVAPEKTSAPTDDNTTDGPKQTTNNSVNNLSDTEKQLVNAYRAKAANK